MLIQSALSVDLHLITKLINTAIQMCVILKNTIPSLLSPKLYQICSIKDVHIVLIKYVIKDIRQPWEVGLIFIFILWIRNMNLGEVK